MPAGAARRAASSSCRSEDEVAAAARALLGTNLVTHQTGPAGREVKRVYVEEGCDIARELYLGVLIDRDTGRITLIASTEGGIEIEEVAARSPEKILKVAIDPATGIEPFHARKHRLWARPRRRADRRRRQIRHGALPALLPSSTPRWSRSTRWS